MKIGRSLICLSALAVAGSASAVTLDGANIPLEGLTLRATQNSPTAFGNSTGGTQSSSGGSELNQLFADVTGGTLNIGMTGNLEANFNKLFIFIDAVAGGENVLASDNADGGFGEINNLAGLTFAGGATPDHGLRFEIGDGFHEINAFDLIDNTAFSVTSGGGPGDLPLSSVGSGGYTLGWDNSNALGVTSATASTADTATTGFEISIDLLTAFGASLNSDNIGITALITSGDGSFVSNQILPGINRADNAGSANGLNVGVALVQVPEPASLALLGLGGLMILRRRTSR